MDARILRIGLRPLLLTLLLFLTLVSLGFLCDLILIQTGWMQTPLIQALLPAREVAVNLIGNTLELQGALVGLAITVASIMVQLSATRYSARALDLFAEDRINLAQFALFIVTPFYGLWLMFLGQAIPWPTAHILIFKGLSLLCVLCLLPYFRYLFFFLQPERLVERIRAGAQVQRLSATLSPRELEAQQRNLEQCVTQLSDVVASCLSNSDQRLAQRSIEQLRNVATEYLHVKNRLPDAWFSLPRDAFPGWEEARLARLASDRTWVEMHVLKQLEGIYVVSLNRSREIAAAIGHRTREVGMTALQVEDARALELTLMFFNTWLRHAINAGDLRTLFHIFYHYRRLAEGCLGEPWIPTLLRVANHFKYYGQECEKRGVHFAMEIAAYDLRVLVERAWSVCHEAVEPLLTTFLEVDRIPDTTETAQSQRGVRKHQAILAAFLLAHSEEMLARRIFEDMKHEPRELLRSIHAELSAITSPDYWEIQERGTNFYFVPLHQRAELSRFFLWLEEQEPEDRD